MIILHPLSYFRSLLAAEPSEQERRRYWDEQFEGKGLTYDEVARWYEYERVKEDD